MKESPCTWRIKFLTISVALSFAAIPVLLAYSVGPPARKTGSSRFGENSCTECHTGTANSGSGSLELSGVPNSYVPGQKYNIRVTLQQEGRSRWGFELATRTDNGAQAGQLEAGADGYTQIITDNGVQFIEHTSTGTRAGTANGPVNFDFAWTAPTINVGEIYFSVAGNAANNNGDADSGDSIYTKEERVDQTSGSTVSPSSNALIVPFVIDTAQFRTNLGMSNLTSNPVDVSVELVEESGTSLATKSFSVPASGLNQVGNVVRNLLDATSVANKQGYLILEPSAAGSIAAFATPIDNSTQDSSVIQGTRGKSTKVVLPTSTSTGRFKTTLTMINDSSASNSVEIELYSTSGASLKTQTVTLAPFGSFSTDDIHAFLGASGTFGPIELTSTGANPKPIIAISRVYAALTTSDGKIGTVSSFFVAEPVQ